MESIRDLPLLHEYVTNQWVGEFKERWSDVYRNFFLAENSTTNICEGFHAAIKSSRGCVRTARIDSTLYNLFGDGGEGRTVATSRPSCWPTRRSTSGIPGEWQTCSTRARTHTRS